MVNIRKIDFKNKRVFLRCDFNVPLLNGKITSDIRIRNSLRTIEFILKQKPKQLILASHLGRPSAWDDSLSMSIIAKRLAKLLKKNIYLHANILAPIESDEKIILLENLRFWPGEKKGSLKFAKSLFQHADIYINDAFGTAHRKDASVYALPKLFPKTRKSWGFLIGDELKEIHLNHKKPLVVIFGAAKLGTKIPLLDHLLSRVDKLILGGGVVFTFLKAIGVEVGTSLVEDSEVSVAKKLLRKHGSKIVFPVDFVVAPKSVLNKSLSERRLKKSVVEFDKIPKNRAGFDIGPRSVKLFSFVLERSNTIIWNGPLGVFEYPPFDYSTKRISRKLADLAEKKGVHTIVCGGDTVSAVYKTKYHSKIGFLSTGGGASLQLLSGKKLPAIEVLR